MKNLKILSLLEGTSLILLLFIAVPVKRLLEFPELVQIIGPIHGVLFIVFNLLLLNALRLKQLTFVQTIIGFIASLIPFGSFVFKAKILNKLNA
jgi:integral membrane protein